MSLTILKTIPLDFTRNAPLEYVFTKAGDQNSRILDITPLNSGAAYTIPEGATARFAAKKPDGTQILNDVTIESGHIKVTLSEQTLAVEGILVCEVQLYGSDNEVLSSQHFYLKNEPFALSDVESSDEYESLRVALLAVDAKVQEAEAAISDAQEATSDANEAAELANTKAEFANTKAALADEKATLANEKAALADQKAALADQKAGEAEQAATTANGAAGLANEKALLADQKATEAGRVNISAAATATGADITVVDRDGVETTVHIDTLTAVSTFADVRNAVRLGLGETLFPVGYEFAVSKTGSGNIVFVVRGHDHHAAANGRLTHTMTLEMKYVFGSSSAYKGLQFDAPEAFYYAESGLAVGTYNFKLLTGYDLDYGGGKTYQFTLTQAVPVGGVLTFPWGYNIQASTVKVYSWANNSDTTGIENVPVTEGTDGVALGEVNGTGNLNHTHRIRYGSNNYAQSAVRQWLNSNAAAGSVWAPKTKFDRAPSWAGAGDSAYSGFSNGIDPEFLAVVEAAIIPCRTNSIHEVNSLDGTVFTVNQTYNLNDKFFLLSRPEIYGTWDSATYKDGEFLDYYNGLTDAERMKFDSFGTVRYAWLRSPNPGFANYERIVYTSGAVDGYRAYSAYGAAVACIIA